MTRFAAQYAEIRPDERIVTTYTMHQDTQLMSVSVATVELATVTDERGSPTPSWARTLAVDDDGWDPAGRREGTEGLLDTLGATSTQVAV